MSSELNKTVLNNIFSIDVKIRNITLLYLYSLQTLCFDWLDSIGYVVYLDHGKSQARDHETSNSLGF